MDSRIENVGNVNQVFCVQCAVVTLYSYCFYLRSISIFNTKGQIILFAKSVYSERLITVMNDADY